MRFQNQVVIVTGAGSGIGKETAKRFYNEGASLVLNGRDPSKLRATVTELGATEERVRILAADIGLPETGRKLTELATSAFGGVDILVNNAGIFKPKPFVEITEEEYDGFLDTILKGKFFAAQAAAIAMKKRGKGAIVQTGSMWALLAVAATPSSAYSAANAGVHAMVRNLAIELAPDKIRVNAVAPAVVETPVYNTFMTDQQVSEILPTFNAFHPIGRNGQAADVAEAILFLASDAASWITGVVLPVDGGVTAGR